MDRLRKIVREEIRRVLSERVSSKVLGRDKLKDVLKDYIEKNYQFNEDYLDDKISITPETTGVERLIVNLPPELDDENWQEFFKRYGYYVSWTDSNSRMFKLVLYPYETDRVKNANKPLFHITPKNKLLKIKRKGLSPRRSSKIYDVKDPRIYFVRNNEEGIDQLNILFRQLANYTDVKRPFRNEMAMLKVDPDKTDAKFYEDPEISDWGVYTRENIRPEAVMNWDEFQEELETLKKRS